MELELQAVIQAVGGRCLNPDRLGGHIIRHINTDSRQIDKFSLFVPLKGDRFDGHKFISQVFDQGAAATLTEECIVQDDRLCTIWVKDTKEALLKLAAYYRSLFEIPVIAVTGSVGKTSTKEIIAAVLSAKFNVHKTEGNYNNEIGLPLTLFKLNKTHQVAVLEMGMNHFGEIHNLSMTAHPQIAVITNIGTSHIENLGSREGILKAKLEILDGLDDKGLLVINGDNDMLKTVKGMPYKTIYYGMSHHSAYYAENIKSDKESTVADIFTPNEKYSIKINALGEHMVYNSLAAVAIAEHLGLTKDEIVNGLASYVPSKMRMHIQTFSNRVTVMDDTYNASPDSMHAALKVLKNYPGAKRIIAVLGDMLEMGDYAVSLHQEVGRYACEAEIDILYAVGTLARHIYEGAVDTSSVLKVMYFHTKEEFLKNVDSLIRSEDTVLFKASRGMHFEELVEAVGKVKCDE